MEKNKNNNINKPKIKNNKRKNKNKKTINKRVLRKEVNADVNKQMARLSVNNSLKREFYYSLLYPELNAAKVPRRPRQSIRLHRILRGTITTNALGYGAIAFAPTVLTSATGPLTSLVTNVSATFDPVNGVIGTSNGVAVNYQLSDNTIAEWRVVSCCMKVYTQASVLNSAGTIHSSIVPIKNPTLVAAGPQAGYDLFLKLPSLTGTRNYATASVSAGMGMRSLWLPTDDCNFELVSINIQQSTNLQENTIVSIITGAPTTAFNYEIYLNFEVTPVSYSTCAGMETLDCGGEDPYAVLQKIWVDDQIFPTVPYSPTTIAKMFAYNSNGVVLRQAHN